MNPTDEIVDETIGVPKDARTSIDLYSGRNTNIKNGQIELRLEANSAGCIMFDSS
jgi:hypothetical protein